MAYMSTLFLLAALLGGEPPAQAEWGLPVLPPSVVWRAIVQRIDDRERGVTCYIARAAGHQLSISCVRLDAGPLP